MITVACVWVRANVPYTVDYVLNLRAMVRRHLTSPHRFVCLTDRPEILENHGIEAIPVPSPKPLPGWWSKVRLFDRSHVFGRVLYLDLDTLVVSSLEPLVNFSAPFALIPDAGTFKPKGDLQVVKRFNSSVMVWDAGVNASLFDAWSAKVAARLWGDQDWIGEQMPDAAVMPAAWFPRLSELNGQPPTSLAKVVLSKKPKNHIAADLYPWFGDAWRAA